MSEPRRRLAFLLIAALLLQPPAARTRAQWVVTDPGNLIQNIISALQTVNSVLKQVQQYKTQLDQYTAQLRDIAAPAVYVWDLVDDTVATAKNVAGTLTNARQLVKTAHASLSQLGDPDYYRSSPCYNGQELPKYVTAATAPQNSPQVDVDPSSTGCALFLATLQAAQRESTQRQYKTNEELLKALDKQQESMDARLKRVQKLVKSSEHADGQLQAVQATNQLASAQIAELMEMRSLLLAQQNLAVEAKRQELEKQAAAQAAAASFFAGEHKPTPSPQGW